MSKNTTIGDWLDLTKAGNTLSESLQAAYRDWEHTPQLHISPNATDVETATQRYLLYLMLPAWFAPSVLDYIMHRRTKIEETSGTPEALLHCLMMAEIGVPTVMALLLEVNPLVLTVMSGAMLAHEATILWDIQLAVDSGREIPPNEQHIHSFLEVMPVMALSFMAILHWEQVQAIFGRGSKKPQWRLQWKQRRFSKGYMAGIIAATFGFIVLPYADEVIRCLKTKRP